MERCVRGVGISVLGERAGMSVYEGCVQADVDLVVEVGGENIDG